MDFDLVTDLYSFCPEKYFLSRLLTLYPTRISFVDYQRKHYKVLNGNFYQGGVLHQEYGPSVIRDDFIMFSTRGITHRRFGPAHITKYFYYYYLFGKYTGFLLVSALEHE